MRTAGRVVLDIVLEIVLEIVLDIVFVSQISEATRSRRRTTRARRSSRRFRRDVDATVSFGAVGRSRRVGRDGVRQDVGVRRFPRIDGARIGVRRAVVPRRGVRVSRDVLRDARWAPAAACPESATVGAFHRPSRTRTRTRTPSVRIPELDCYPSNRPSPTRAPVGGILTRASRYPSASGGGCPASRLGPKRAGRATRTSRRFTSSIGRESSRRGRRRSRRRRSSPSRAREGSGSRRRVRAERRRPIRIRSGVGYSSAARVTRTGSPPTRTRTVAYPGRRKRRKRRKRRGKKRRVARARKRARATVEAGGAAARAPRRRGSARVGRTRGDAPGEAARVGGHRRSRRRRVTFLERARERERIDERTNERTNGRTNERSSCTDTQAHTSHTGTGTRTRLRYPSR